MTVILSRSTAAGSELPLLLHLGSLTNTIAQVVELGSADVATGPDLDAVDDRRVDREGPLNPDTETELANRERFADSAALALYDHALEQLHALAVALDHADVHLEGIAGVEVRNVVTKVLVIDEIGGLHGSSSRSLWPIRQSGLFGVRPISGSGPTSKHTAIDQ